MSERPTHKGWWIHKSGQVVRVMLSHSNVLYFDDYDDNVHGFPVDGDRLPVGDWMPVGFNQSEPEQPIEPAEVAGREIANAITDSAKDHLAKCGDLKYWWASWATPTIIIRKLGVNSHAEVVAAIEEYEAALRNRRP